MPLFSFGSGRFSSKRSSLRKSQSITSLNASFDPATREAELGLEPGPLKLVLGNHKLSFTENGQWITESSASHQEVQKLRKENKSLEEENNLLKLKVEMLLDMVAERTAEYFLQEKELEYMKDRQKRKL